MTPNEIYALPNTGEENWYDSSDSLLYEVFGIDFHGFDEGQHNDQLVRLIVENKLFYSSDGERSVQIQALSFDDVRFGIYLSAGRGGQDYMQSVITDVETYSAAKAYVLSCLNSKINCTVVDPTKELVSGFYDAAIVRVDGKVRLVSQDHASGLTGNLVFNEDAFLNKFNKSRPKIAIDDAGLINPNIAELAANSILAAIPCDTKRILNQRSTNGKWIAAVALIEGETYVISVPSHVVTSKGYSFVRSVSVNCVGPASFYECYDEHYAGRGINADSKLARELVETFGATPDEARSAIFLTIEEDFRRLADATIHMINSRNEPPEAYNNVDPDILLYRHVVENPEVTRFCRDGYPDVRQAKELLLKLDPEYSAPEASAPKM